MPTKITGYTIIKVARNDEGGICTTNAPSPLLPQSRFEKGRCILRTYFVLSFAHLLVHFIKFEFSSTLHPHVLPSPETPLMKYALFLQACYAKHEFTSLKWPHLDARKFINLAVINNKYANRTHTFQATNYSCSIDDILEWKAPIEMKDILKPSCIQEHDFNTNKKVIKEYPVTQLLIEGAPGIGKSTHARECVRSGASTSFSMSIP